MIFTRNLMPAKNIGYLKIEVIFKGKTSASALKSKAIDFNNLKIQTI